MLRVGLTGGLASGKSFIGQTLASLGCHVLSADKLGHEVLAPGGEAYAGVLEAFGRGILKNDGTIDRRALGEVVFQDPARLAQLNSLVHPPVLRRQDEWIAAVAAADPGGIVVVEAAIMIEAGTYRRHEKLMVAVCSEEQQIRRAMKRDRLSREQVLMRLARQMPLAEKARLADYVIDTSGDKQATVRRIEEVHGDLRRLAGERSSSS